MGQILSNWQRLYLAFKRY